MRVKLNLKIKTAADNLPRKVYLSKLGLIILAVVIFIVGDYALGLGLYKRGGYLEEIKALSGDEVTLTQSLQTAEGQVAKQKKYYDERIATLSFVLQNDIPCIELIAVLEAALPPDINLELLDINNDSVSLAGFSPSDGLVVSLVDTLKQIPLFASVNLPSTQAHAAGGVSFTVSCVIDKTQIKKDGGISNEAN